MSRRGLAWLATGDGGGGAKQESRRAVVRATLKEKQNKGTLETKQSETKKVRAQAIVSDVRAFERSCPLS